jgi:hypothetical protein
MVEGYQRRFSELPDQRVLINVHRHLKEDGTFPQLRRERPLQRNVHVEDDVLEMNDFSPASSVRRISDRVGASGTHVWRTLQVFGLYAFHMQTVHAL